MFAFIKTFLQVLKNPPEPNWHIERQAKPSDTHPLGGFWKRNIKHDHGLAIGPADGSKYFISFCGPSGCFEKGQYRSDSTIEGDPDYQIVDKNTIEVRGKKGFTRYVRANAPKRA